MIEQEITLLTNGRISFQKCGNGLQFGYSKNRGVYSIKVKTSGEWNGLTIRAFWHIPDIKEPITSLLVDNVIRVPALVTSYKGEGRIVFEGSDGAKTVTSADVRYYVNKNSGTCDGTIPEPGTPAWQELVGTVKKYSDTAVEAKESAKKSADEAKQALEDTKDVKSQAIEEINSSKTAVIEEIENKKNLSIEEINSVKEDAKGELEALCDSTRDFANQAKEAADRAKASELASKKNADDSAATLQELKDGIASGDFKGDKGDPGPAGKDGTQIDDTTVGPDAWSSKHIVDMLCPPLEGTGNPVQCYPMAGYPLGVTASWEPTQEGSGDPSPDNIRPISGRDAVKVERCGENLLNLPIEKESGGISVTTEPDGRYHLRGTLNMDGFSCSIGTVRLPAGTYTVNRASISTPLSTNAIVITLRKNTPTGSVAWIETSIGVGKNTGSLAKPTNISISFYGAIASIKKGTVIDTYFELILVSGTTAPTTYAPYTGQTAALTLPRTIYGGTVDAVTGEGRGRWKLLTLDGTEPWNAVGFGDTLYFQSTSISIGTRVLSRGDYCTTFPIASVSSSNTVQGVSGWKTSLYLRWSTFANVAALKSYLAAQYAAGTPVQVCYKLATPTPFIATGAQPIPALPGVNTLMTDANSVTVTGRADPIKRITDLEDAVASMTNT